mmetsp:Transcript_31573/g.73981  ORF Transcript_31573/g.73981 Transcript_31573/m.73981 type:complete len:638 (+) Transcript_31573:199-2112(+)
MNTGLKWLYWCPVLLVGLLLVSYGQSSYQRWKFAEGRREGVLLDYDAKIDTINPHRKEEENAVICVVQKEELNYIDEWVDYNLGIGFSDIYIYDNSDDSLLMKEWEMERNDARIHLIPYPGPKVQVSVYKDCAHRVQKLNHTWVAFIDVDEFLVLKEDENVVEFAKKYVPEGHLAINWEMFGTSSLHHYEPFPVTQRFQCIYYTERNQFTKSLIKVADLGDIDKIRSPHAFPIRNGTQRVDTDGRPARGSRHEGPRDVAVFNHYYYKSFEEYVEKRERGDVFYGAKGVKPNITAMAKAGLGLSGEPLASGYKRDDSAWQALKKLVPAYETYEQGPSAKPECSDEIPSSLAIKTTDSVALCAMHKNETFYITEWTDYHLALGFSDIYLYDNSKELWHLSEWTKRHGDPRIHYTDFEGDGMQIDAYQACAKRAIARNHTWAMFLDIDQFLSLKKHLSVLDFAMDYGKNGHIGLNWQVFGTAGRNEYEASPVTYRFQCQLLECEMNENVQSLVNLRDLDGIDKIDSPHIFPSKKGSTWDTDGNTIESQQHDGPRDVAVVNHYFYRSRQEYIEKLLRGDAMTGEKPDETMIWEAEAGNDPYTGAAMPTGDVRDNSVWETLKELIPKYANQEKKQLKDPMAC